MAFICTLDPGPTDVSGRSIKCFSECSQDPLHPNPPNPLGCLIKIQIPRPTVGLPGSVSWEWSLDSAFWTSSSPGDCDPQQSYRRVLVFGGRWGGTYRSCHKWQEASEGERRSQITGRCADHKLTPSCFSHESSQPGLTHPWELAVEKLPEEAANPPADCGDLWSWGGGWCCPQKEGSKSGAIGAKWGCAHLEGPPRPTRGVGLKPLLLDRVPSQGHRRSWDRLWSHLLGFRGCIP